MPKLSIITINLNNKTGLQRTLKSVIEQTYKDFEYIVIDGGSVDGSVDVIKTNESAIRYHVSEKDTGIYNAMNKGLKKANGEYCLFLNSGDYLFAPDVLENIFSQNFTEDILYGDMMIEDASGKQYKGQMPESLTFEHMINDTLWHPVSFIKRSLFNTYGYYREDITIISDYDFFLKAILVNKVSYRHIHIIVSVFLLNGISSDPKNDVFLKTERRKVQLQYFSETEIDAVPKKKSHKRNLLRKIIDRLKK
ncbi:MAG TPA: glycosyltransferase family 2 protein [Bacteroidia bacterium]|nr:glycosyltransferase family 2 protein [Bacteroidia bacterium]